MDENFDMAVDFILRCEGDIANDPRDAGGLTKFGISKRAYPDLDIANLSRDHAKAIYRKDYWQRAGCGMLPYPLDIIVFDTAVNMGITKAVELKKQAGDWTDYLFRRLAEYTRLAKQSPVFLRGWITRVVNLYDFVTRGSA